MLRYEPFFTALIINILLGCLWHLITFIICVTVPTDFFAPDKKMYCPRKWERGGKFYSGVLKINKWKDAVPQYIGKDGFSKDHIDSLSVEYLDEFIMETCRAEWNHAVNCMFTLVLFILNDIVMASVLSIIVYLCNLPFAIIQRYNRFRLEKLKQAVLKKEKNRKSE